MILDGAFMDLLGAVIQPNIRRVLSWRDADQPLDFTTKDDVAAVAPDDTAPRLLRIAGHTVSTRDMAAVSELTAQQSRSLRTEGLGSLDLMIRAAQLVAPQAR